MNRNKCRTNEKSYEQKHYKGRTNVLRKAMNRNKCRTNVLTYKRNL